MTKDQRTKQLEQLAHSSQGQALKEYFDELIIELVDASNYSAADFEKEGRAKVEAARILKKVIKTLNLLKLPKETKDHKEYI